MPNNSIPASAIVNVLPGVISAGGTGLDLVGLLLTTNTVVPTGAVLTFSSAADVAAYFGALSDEATMATVYFAGYDGSFQKPAQIKFYRYVDTAAPAFLRGGRLGLTLAQLQALSGVLTVTTSGTVKTSATINLAAATDFNNAASIIQAAFTSPGFTVSYNSTFDAFVFTNSATGASSTLTAATGTLSAGLKLTVATGAVLSQGAAVDTPAGCMAALTALTQDFVSFSTVFAPSDANKLAFAVWADAQNNRYLYVGWDNNSQATVANDATSVGSQIKANSYDSVAMVYDPTNGIKIAAFVMGALASTDFSRENGRFTMAFRSGNVAAGVTNQTIAANLIANGYNFVGAYGSANDQWTVFYPGQVSGVFRWIDSWIAQVWMNNAAQLALLQLLTSVGQVPYNSDGYALIEASLRGVINDALNFGAIRAGVALSAQQAIVVNNLASRDIANVLSQRGWYVLVKDPGATVRANRGTPVTTIFYTDGQSVQQIVLSSLNVQ